jgi:DNA-binding MarR family transcriptional regulator
MLEPSPDVSRIIDRLVLAGLVRRVQDSSNRRKLKLGITDAGLELLKQIDCRRKSMIDPLAGCSDAEVSQFNTLLDKVLEQLPERTALFDYGQME